jgi:hypothetical protein
MRVNLVIELNYNDMKKLIILISIAIAPYIVSAQSCAQSCNPTCDKKSSCGPEGTKKGEAAVITTMRTDLQSVIGKMSKSSTAFDQQVKQMTIEQGANDDESLLFLSNAATTIRFEMITKVDRSKMSASLRDYKPATATTKQQMVANLKKEIQLLATQAEEL